MDGGGEVRLFRLVTTARTISWTVFASLLPDMLIVVSCTTFCSGVLVRNVFPVPFELKFCQFDFDYCRFE